MHSLFYIMVQFCWLKLESEGKWTHALSFLFFPLFFFYGKYSKMSNINMDYSKVLSFSDEFGEEGL